MVKIILATGGTGGHIFPALSLAKELNLRGYQAIIFADARFLNYAKNQSEVDFHIISSSFLTKSIFDKITTTTKLVVGIIQAIRLLIKHKPKVVIGFGSYSSLPTVFAALLLNIPIILHEQNCYMGKVNKFFSKFCKVLASSSSSLYNISGTPIHNLLPVSQYGNSKTKIVWTGNPVREFIRDIGSTPYPNFTGKQLNILVVGGSQGAAVFSQVIPQAIAALPADIQMKINIVQQCRIENISSVEAIYNKIGIKYQLATFFEDMSDKFKECHLVITRAGASTVAELSEAGRPSILVPYPYAGDHQKYNAYDITKRQAGWMIMQNDCDVNIVTSLLLSFFSDPNILNNAAANARAAKTNATKNLADLAESVIKDIMR